MPLSKNARQENKGAKSLNFLARGKIRAQQDLATRPFKLCCNVL